MSGSTVEPHDKMRARDVSKVARGEQAPRPPQRSPPVSHPPPPSSTTPKAESSRLEEESASNSSQKATMLTTSAFKKREQRQKSATRLVNTTNQDWELEDSVITNLCFNFTRLYLASVWT